MDLFRQAFSHEILASNLLVHNAVRDDDKMATPEFPRLAFPETATSVNGSV
jgi:hypothetical protein